MGLLLALDLPGLSRASLRRRHLQLPTRLMTLGYPGLGA